jgi:hypothetical protein
MFRVFLLLLVASVGVCLGGEIGQAFYSEEVLPSVIPDPVNTKTLDRVYSFSGSTPEKVAPYLFVTRHGYVAATREVLLDQAIRLAVSGDQKAFLKFVSANPSVFLLKGGLMVTVEGSAWPGKVRIRPTAVGISIWTIKEAIE